MSPTPDSPRIVGLTGGIGSGKSTVMRLFAALDVPCIDADDVARAIHQDPSHPATAEIARAIPQAVDADGKLSRGSLRKIVVADENANLQLKRILKPYVMGQLKRWTQQQNACYVIWESALIIDEKIPVDRVLVVETSDATRIARIQIRNPDWTPDQIKNILAIQLSNAAYRTSAHDVIQNDGTTEHLQEQIAALHTHYLTCWS